MDDGGRSTTKADAQVVLKKTRRVSQARRKIESGAVGTIDVGVGADDLLL